VSDSINTRGIAILGSTGSIGTQALEVIREQKERLHVEVLSAHRNAKLLVEQALEFRPNAVVIGQRELFQEVNTILFDEGIKVYAGPESLEQVVEMEGVDMVLTALMGAAGLKPTLRAIKAGKSIALANKETLVVAGELVMAAARQAGVDIHPVDSEHSAIYQCLAGEILNPIEKIILTASGGPFRGMNRSQLEAVTKAQALKHPNWDMGAKITIDSASMMNKGLEVIEAKWLFDLRMDQVDVVVHPAKHCTQLCSVSRRIDQSSIGPARYETAHPIRLGLPPSLAQCVRSVQLYGLSSIDI